MWIGFSFSHAIDYPESYCSFIPGEEIDSLRVLSLATVDTFRSWRFI